MQHNILQSLFGRQCFLVLVGLFLLPGQFTWAQLDVPLRGESGEIILGLGTLRNVAFSPGGEHVATCGGIGAFLWDAATGEVIRWFSGHTEKVNSVAFSPDGGRILTGSDDGTAKLWDTATGEEIRMFSGHTEKVNSVAFSPDGTKVLTGSYDDTAKLWDAQTGEEVRTFSGHAESLSSAVFSPDGTKVLTGSYDYTAKLWDAQTGEEVRTFSDGHPVNFVAFSPDGTSVLAGRVTANLWDAETGERIRTFSGHEDHVASAVFSPDGTKVLTGSYDDTAKLWDVETGAELRTFAGHTWWVMSVAFSPGGTKVLTGSPDGTAKLWDAARGAEIHPFSGHWVGIVTCAVFSPDGTKVFTTRSSDETTTLWNAATGAEIETFSGEACVASSVVSSPDGAKVLTGGSGNTAELRDAATGDLIQTFSGHTGKVTSVAFSPDGARIVTASRDGTGRIWSVTPQPPPTNTPTPSIVTPPPASEVMKTLAADFSLEFHSVLEYGASEWRPAYNDIVPGANNDFLRLEYPRDQEDTVAVLTWYSGDAKEEIAATGNEWSIESIHAWGHRDVMLIVCPTGNPEADRYVYRLTGRFEPTVIEGWGGTVRVCAMRNWSSKPDYWPTATRLAGPA